MSDNVLSEADRCRAISGMQLPGLTPMLSAAPLGSHHSCLAPAQSLLEHFTINPNSTQHFSPQPFVIALQSLTIALHLHFTCKQDAEIHIVAQHDSMG